MNMQFLSQNQNSPVQQKLKIYSRENQTEEGFQQNSLIEMYAVIILLLDIQKSCKHGLFKCDFRNFQLNLFENLCTPQISKNSFIAKSTQKLFESKSKADCDMIFEIPQGILCKLYSNF